MMKKLRGEIKTDMSSPPRAPSDLHWQSKITWVINDANDDDDKTDDNDKTNDDDKTDKDENNDGSIFRFGNEDSVWWLNPFHNLDI